MMMLGRPKKFWIDQELFVSGKDRHRCYLLHARPHSIGSRKSCWGRLVMSPCCRPRRSTAAKIWASTGRHAARCRYSSPRAMGLRLRRLCSAPRVLGLLRGNFRKRPYSSVDYACIEPNRSISSKQLSPTDRDRGKRCGPHETKMESQ
jgi:hypothetical protein